ncbi:MAG: osmC [Firmicutes bacterium]|nr:osmC [Bacillota bacterium]
MIISKSMSENYKTEISNGSAVICSDVTEDKGGNGEYFGPHDLLCASLASCLNITARMVLDRMNVAYEKVVVKVDLDRTDEARTGFLYDVEIIGDVSEEVKQKVINLLSKCPVHKTLAKESYFDKL